MNRFSTISYDDTYFLNKEDVSYLNDIFFDEDKNLVVRPYNEIKDIPQTHIALFCLQNGIYSLPTKELIDFLHQEVGEDNLQQCIEIASGNGVYARELGIIATDSYMQENDAIAKIYEESGQPTVSYGANVEKLDALAAIKKYKPKIILAAWCTHRYNVKEHWREGNALGVNERSILEKVGKYIHIGNEVIHNKKPILNKPHRKIKEEWIMSRSKHTGSNVIYIWG